MACSDDPTALDEAIVAERAARLAAAAEAAAERAGREPPLYVIGTRGAGPRRLRARRRRSRDHSSRIGARDHRGAPSRFRVRGRRDAHSSASSPSSYSPASSSIIGESSITKPAKAKRLGRLLDAEPTIVFEAHSTDYQSPAALAALVSDGFAILKVGPALTFAMREALYGLDHIARETDPSWGGNALEPEMERIMLAEPKYWLDYYRGGPGAAASPPTLQLQ